MNRQNDWAKRAREALRVALGNTCKQCGSTHNLEFDCIAPQGHEHHSKGRYFRTLFYRKQFATKNLQLLCKECHIQKSITELP